MATQITVNGAQQIVNASSDTPLLYVLRDELGLNGPKFGCGLSQCACAPCTSTAGPCARVCLPCRITLNRIAVAHDCGLIINPDGLKNQIEGNVIQSASRALLEQVSFDTSKITSVDWRTYPILRSRTFPSSISP